MMARLALAYRVWPITSWLASGGPQLDHSVRRVANVMGEDMHPRKAKVLATIRETATVIDGMLQQHMHVALHPGQYGWSGSLFAAGVLLPLTGVNAVLTDVTEAVLERSDDATWARAFPARSDGEPADRPA